MRRTLTVTSLLLAASIAAAGCGRTSGKAAADATTAKPPTAPPPTATATATVPTALPTTPTPSPTPTVFSAQISKLPAGSVKHSWHEGCPVSVSELRSISMPYWGMDGKPHPGQLIVNASVASDVTKVFKKLYDHHYPIRLMQPIDAYKGSDTASIDADNTSSFNCRAATGSSSWSQHAYGLAIDINPCENPYVDTDGSIAHPKCVIYGDRSRHDPGLIHNGDFVVKAFESIGWGWGGTWNGAKDYQHFSSNGR